MGQSPGAHHVTLTLYKVVSQVAQDRCHAHDMVPFTRSHEVGVLFGHLPWASEASEADPCRPLLSLRTVFVSGTEKRPTRNPLKLGKTASVPWTIDLRTAGVSASRPEGRARVKRFWWRTAVAQKLQDLVPVCFWEWFWFPWFLGVCCGESATRSAPPFRPWSHQTRFRPPGRSPQCPKGRRWMQ